MNRRREEHKRPEQHVRILDTFGHAHQILKMIEELGELQDALTSYQIIKNLNVSEHEQENSMRAVRLEIADVYNVLEQMVLIFGTVDDEREYKMRRTLARIEKGEG